MEPLSQERCHVEGAATGVDLIVEHDHNGPWKCIDITEDVDQLGLAGHDVAALDRHNTRQLDPQVILDFDNGLAEALVGAVVGEGQAHAAPSCLRIFDDELEKSTRQDDRRDEA